ncbi:MAG: ion channel [Terriglobales bacterium]
MPSKPFVRWRQQYREQSLTVVLVVEGIFILLVVPLGMLFPVPSVLLSSVIVLILACVIMILSANRAATLFVVAAIVLGRFAGLASERLHSLQATWLDDGTCLMTVVALSWSVAKGVFGPGRVTAHHIRGAIVLYLNFAVGFSAVYEIALTLLPHAFFGVSPGASHLELRANLLYFSFSTLTTAGFGDITPIQPFVRSLVNLESVIGALYPAIMIARIVTLAVRDEMREG